MTILILIFFSGTPASPANADDEAIFEMSLSFMLAGLDARAPRPCTCPKHAGAAGT